MQKSKRVMGIMATTILLSSFVPTYATETRFQRDEAAVSMAIDESAVSSTTDTSITFGENEYIRITQPIQSDINSPVHTFEGQINLMGVAREGIKLTIRVYEGSYQDDNVVRGGLIRTYEIEEIGVTQTFNQLIDLEEGLNYISISYTDTKEKNVYGVENITIQRESEETKELLTNFIVESLPSTDASK